MHSTFAVVKWFVCVFYAYYSCLTEIYFLREELATFFYPHNLFIKIWFHFKNTDGFLCYPNEHRRKQPMRHRSDIYMSLPNSIYQSARHIFPKATENGELFRLQHDGWVGLMERAIHVCSRNQQRLHFKFIANTAIAACYVYVG